MTTIINWFVNIFKKKGKVTVERLPDNTPLQAIQKQIPKDPHETTIIDSTIRLNDLKIFVNYFGDNTLDKIYQQTKVIHDVFEGNKDLNCKKLEQFHYYYTDHLVELLRKLKKKKDEKFLVLNSQIKSIRENYQSNKVKQSKIINNSVKKSENNKAKYAEYISLQLTAIYNCLIDNFNDFRFKTKYNLHTYTIEFGLDLAWNIDLQTFTQLTDFDISTQFAYTYEEYTIQRKLMGKLQKNLFHIQFLGIVKLNDQKDVFELYKITETDDYFIFIHDKGYFKFIDYSILKPWCNDQNTRYGELGENILEQENSLKKLEYKVKENIDVTEIDDSLQKYLEVINGVELLDEFSQIDVERQNLQSILDLTRLEV